MAYEVHVSIQHGLIQWMQRMNKVALPHCSMLLQGRVEHKTVEVPCASFSACGSVAPALPALLQSFMPWTNTSSSESGCGDPACSSYSGSSCNDISMASSGFEPATFSCSAFIDASSAALQAAALPMAQPSAAAAAAAAGGDGTQLQEVDVYLPGCPLNSYPAKNKDNHLCIMCGKHCCCMVCGPYIR